MSLDKFRASVQCLLVAFSQIKILARTVGGKLKKLFQGTLDQIELGSKQEKLLLCRVLAFTEALVDLPCDVGTLDEVPYTPSKAHDVE